MKKFTFLILLLAAVVIGYSQSVIHSESFESAPNGEAVDYAIDTEFGGSDANDYFQRITITGNGKDEIDTGVTGGDGTYMIAGEDIDGGPPTPKVVTIVDVSVSGYSNIEVTVAFGSGEQNKYDAGDYIELFVKKDGGSETLIAAFYGYDHANDDPTNGRMYEDENLDGSTSDNNNNILSKALTDYTYSISGATSSLQVIVKMTTNSGDEVLMVDNVVISGLAAGGVSNPTDFEAITGGTDNIDLSWTLNAAGDDVMVAYTTDGAFGTPVDGTAYTVGNTIVGGGEVIYNGSGTSHNHSGLTADTRYYYKVWSLDATPDYSSGVTDDTTTYAAEPTADATIFTATTNSFSEITLDWTDAVPAAASYLIKGSDVDFASIANPNDGITEADALLVQNVASGIQTHQFTGLTPGTTYYFKIYPYNGDNGSVNYKTDSPAEVSGNTDPFTAPNVFISEYIEGSNSNKAIEIVNATGGILVLSDFTVKTAPNGGDWNYTLNLTGSLNQGAVYVIGNVGAFDVVKAKSDVFSSVTFFNGDDAVGLFYQGQFIDGIGVQGEDPGSAWDVAGTTNATLNHTLVRKLSVTTGNTDWTSSAGTDAGNSEWIVYNENHFFNLGIFGAGWGGATNNDWDDITNWDVQIPDATVSALINVSATNYPTLTAAATCNDIIIESNADGNASILGNSNLTVSGTATVERYFEGYNNALNGWHNISSPVDNMTIAGSDFDPGTDDDLYRWDEPTATWENFKAGHADFTNFENGTGYLAAFKLDVTKVFEGTLNNADETLPTLTLTGDDGWHLLGNPFPSAVTWDLPTVGWNRTGIAATAKIWNEVSGNYADIGSSGIIPSTNGFFVEVDNATNSLTIPVSARLHDVTNNYKSGHSDEMDETLVMKVTNDENTYYDINRVGFKADATEEWDADFDSHKLFGSGSAPQLWTVTEGDIYSWNNLPPVYESYELPLHFRAGANTTHHLVFEGLDSFFANSEIYLEDIFLEEIIDLREQQSYDFTATTDDEENRFILHFYGVTTTDEKPVLNSTAVFSNQNTVYIKSNKIPQENYRVTVFNVMGQMVYTANLEPSTLSSFQLNEKAGIYIVRVHSGNRSIVQKIMIK